MVTFLGIVTRDHDHPEMKKLTVQWMVTILGMVTMLGMVTVRSNHLNDTRILQEELLLLDCSTCHILPVSP